MNHPEVLRNVLVESFDFLHNFVGLNLSKAFSVFLFCAQPPPPPPFFLKKDWQDLYVMLKESLNSLYL
jgi:hypothetical protein